MIDGFIENIADNFYQQSLGLEIPYPTTETGRDIKAAQKIDSLVEHHKWDGSIEEELYELVVIGEEFGFINGFKCAVALMQNKVEQAVSEERSAE